MLTKVASGALRSLALWVASRNDRGAHRAVGFCLELVCSTRPLSRSQSSPALPRAYLLPERFQSHASVLSPLSLLDVSMALSEPSLQRHHTDMGRNRSRVSMSLSMNRSLSLSPEPCFREPFSVSLVDASRVVVSIASGNDRELLSEPEMENHFRGAFRVRSLKKYLRI